MEKSLRRVVLRRPIELTRLRRLLWSVGSICSTNNSRQLGLEIRIRPPLANSISMTPGFCGEVDETVAKLWRYRHRIAYRRNLRPLTKLLAPVE
jgi:hypothetical protein